MNTVKQENPIAEVIKVRAKIARFQAKFPQVLVPPSTPNRARLQIEADAARQAQIRSPANLKHAMKLYEELQSAKLRYKRLNTPGLLRAIRDAMQEAKNAKDSGRSCNDLMGDTTGMLLLACAVEQRPGVTRRRDWQIDVFWPTVNAFRQAWKI